MSHELSKLPSAFNALEPHIDEMTIRIHYEKHHGGDVNNLPFLAKSFATTISPWVVTADALEPFRVPVAARPDGDPQPLPYLDSPSHRERGGIDLKLAVGVRRARMRESGREVCWLTESEFARIELEGGETRAFLEGGDEVVIRGRCERAGVARIGFGECRGVILPAAG